MNACLTRDFVAGLGGLTLAFTLAPRLASATDTDTLTILRNKPDCGMFRWLQREWSRHGTAGTRTVGVFKT